jgi:hypothetical protein
MFNECRHIKNDGQRCRAAALKGKPYCFFHMKFDRIYKRDRIEMPPIEDSTSVLLAIGQVIRALNYETMDCKRAGLMLYGLQIAATVTARKKETDPAQCVRSIHDLDGKPLEFSEAFFMDTPMLAPENSVCEPPHDCADCPQKESCDKRKALLQQGSPAELPDKPMKNPEEAARQVREELYAIAVQRRNAKPGPHANPPLPPLEEFHKYFAIQAADADSRPSVVASMSSQIAAVPGGPQERSVQER